MKKNLKKLAMIGSLILAEGVISVYNSGGYSTMKDGDNENIRRKYENLEASKLEEKLKTEREALPKSFFLTPDSLNSCIKQAYEEVGKWPKEFDKRLFRLQLKQESGYNVYAKNKYSGASGIGQIMPSTYAGFRDSTNIEKEIFNPVNNIGVSLEYLHFISNYCKKNHPEWNNLDLDNKRRILLACYNAGHGKIKSVNWNLDSEKLTKETKEYHKVIMESYYDPKIRVKI